MLRFRRLRSLQKFASVHASVTNHFNQERSLSSRPLFNQERSLSSRPLFKQNRATTLAAWRGLCAA
jgi:putative transposase